MRKTLALVILSGMTLLCSLNAVSAPPAEKEATAVALLSHQAPDSLEKEVINDLPRRVVGEACAYQVSNNSRELPSRRFVVSKVDEAGFVAAMLNPQGETQGWTHFTAEGNPFLWESKAGSHKNVSIVPHRPYYNYPLVKGKRWQSTYTYTPDSGGTGTMKTESFVEGWEMVTVPAGTFRALKITVKGSYQETVPSGTGSGDHNEVLWYSSATKCFVKYVLKTTNWSGVPHHNMVHELMTYTAQQ